MTPLPILHPTRHRLTCGTRHVSPSEFQPDLRPLPVQHRPHSTCHHPVLSATSILSPNLPSTFHSLYLFSRYVVRLPSALYGIPIMCNVPFWRFLECVIPVISNKIEVIEYNFKVQYLITYRTVRCDLHAVSAIEARHSPML